MDESLKPRLIAPLLLAGVLALIAATVVAAMMTPPKSSSAGSNFAAGNHVLTGTSNSGTAGTASDSAPGATLRPHHRAKPAPVLSTITYTVRPGDARSSISRWFADHGYAALYAINEEKVTGRPSAPPAGSRITIENGVLTVSVAGSAAAEAAGR